MYEIVSIPVVDLQLDARNARLGEEQPSQQAIYHALAKQQVSRLVRLAEDIVENGLDPTTLPAVVPTADRQHKRYRVIEGNRRILALKALETPTIVAAALTTKDQRRLVELSLRYARNPVSSVTCVLFDTEAQALHWVEMRHTGANEGAGLVEWDSNEKDRFRARHRGGLRQPAGQIIDFVTKLEGDGTPNRGIITNVKRLINTKSVRDTLGIDRVGDQVVSYYPADEVVKGLRKVVSDLKSGKVKVGQIYYEEDRQSYLRSFTKKDLPAPSKRLDEPVPLDDLAAGRTRPSRPQKRSATRPKQQPRSALIPSNCAVNPTPPRINAIYNELSSLSVEQYPNACGVLLRVFVELSVDHEIDKAGLMDEKTRNVSPLAKRLKVVADHLHKRRRISDQLLKAMRKIADSQDVIAASATTFNQYVHNQYVFPKPSELRTAWDELQPFMEKLWP